MMEHFPNEQNRANEPSIKSDAEGMAQANETMEELDLLFAKNFSAQGGKFVYCESMSQFFQMLQSLKEQNKWNYIFSWNNQLRELMIKHDFQQGDLGLLMENSDAALSLCDSLIADSGSIMLAPDQATNRKLTTFPPHHLILTNKNSLVPEIEAAIARFSKSYFNRLPSIVELNDEKPVYKANHARILKAEGTKDVYVFYIDATSFE